MLTQIFIPSAATAGCQPEFTKIVSHSFGFTGDFFLGAQTIDTLYFAGDYDPVNGTDTPVWSATKYDFGEAYIAGNLNLKIQEKSAGIALPINLVANDKITLSGTAQYDFTRHWLESGFSTVNLIVGVYYFDCSKEGDPKLFTFIPVTTVEFDGITGTACFSTEITLGSNFDIHTTRIVVGYNTYVTGDGVTPGVPTVLTVSHTLDIQRPCKATIDNFIIKNCCEGSITELVHIPGLVVGDFHVDDEGNCWEVMSESTDVTNFTRNFVDTYASCAECQAANECPLNLKIQSCCVPGAESVTGSLPGLVVGDTFVDNYGLCWSVTGETSEPISEESITVVSIITGNCETCRTENPCPNFYGINSCCTKIQGYIAVPDILNVDDSFVDAQGQCWTVFETDTGVLPTIYGIEVVTVYPVGETDTCTDCITANPCPTEYFITIKSCCDQDRVEVAQVPADYMFFTEGSVFSDYWGLCWEVLSFDTTGVATFEIWPWNDLLDPRFGEYKNCKICQGQNGCFNIYSIRDCQTNIVYNPARVENNGRLIIGDFFSGMIDGATQVTCFEILDYGYPTYPTGAFKVAFKNGPYATCEECQLTLDTIKTLEFSQCCGGPNIIVEYTGSWQTGIGSTAMIPLTEFPGEGPYIPTCVTLVGYSTGTPTVYNQPNGTEYMQDCTECIADFGCPSE